MAPKVGCGAVFPYILPHSSSLHLSYQANSLTTSANSFTAVCWQFCRHLSATRTAFGMPSAEPLPDDMKAAFNRLRSYITAKQRYWRMYVVA